MGPLPFDPLTIAKEDMVIAGIGTSGVVVYIKGTNCVVKKFGLRDQNLHSEKRIYETLQNHGNEHPNILKYYGSVPPEYELFKGGLLFEYHHRGSVMKCLDKLDTLGITMAERSCWPQQAISAVAHIHSLGIIHCDLGVHNFLIGNDGRLILYDFALSAMKGFDRAVATSSRYSHPISYELDHQSVPEDDVFALGTVLYELHYCKRLFEDQTSGQIRRHIQEGKFPDLAKVALPLGSIIKKCWFNRGYKASDALAELGLCNKSSLKPTDL